MIEAEGSTNVLAHLLGFACGVIAGALAASARGAQLLRAMPTWLAAIIPPVMLVIAWGFAQQAGT
jgi:hypothetical protein